MANGSARSSGRWATIGSLSTNRRRFKPGHRESGVRDSKRSRQADCHSPSLARSKLEGPADVLHALFEIAQAAASFLAIGRCQAAAIVLDFEGEFVRFEMQAQPGG